MKHKRWYLFFLIFITVQAGSWSQEKTSGEKGYFGQLNNIEVQADRGNLAKDKNWYKGSAFYHIWVSGFNDSNNDGMGDIAGITEKIDYLKDLGITSILLSPIFESDYKGNNIHGYDVTNYFEVNDKFGTKEDLFELIKRAHKQNIRVMLDFPGNFVSKKHQWFIESQDPENIKRDWFIWNNKPSNDWQRPWGGGNKGNVWYLANKSYYYSGFYGILPDLNYNNRDVRTQMANIMIYWLNQGIDGLRMDSARYYFEDGPQQAADSEDTHQYFQKIRSEVFEKYQSAGETKIMIAQARQDDVITLGTYYGKGSNEFHMVLDYPFSQAVKSVLKKGDNDLLFSHFKTMENNYPKNTVTTTYISNHDLVAERPGTEYAKAPQKAILANVLGLLTPGTPMIYYGNEIGQINSKGSGDSRVRGAFDWEEQESQRNNKDSVLNINKRLIELRQIYSQLKTGGIIQIDNKSDNILAYIRKGENGSVLVVINKGEKSEKIKLDFNKMDIDFNRVTNIWVERKTISKKKNITKLNLGKFKPYEFQIYSLDLQ